MVALVPGSPHGTLGYLHHAVRVQRALTQLSGVPGMGTGPRLTAPAKGREMNTVAKEQSRWGRGKILAIFICKIKLYKIKPQSYHTAKRGV